MTLVPTLRTSLTRALVALLLAVPLALVAGGPADAAACASSTSGVTVVVQRPDGSTRTGCANGDPSSGLAALEAAGFPYTFPADGQNPGFVCTISGLPSDQRCMSPASWSYFHASRGGSWSYATTGAAGYDPRPGSVEGWRFGTTKAGPSTRPPGGTAAATPAPSRAGSGGGSGGTAGGTRPRSGSSSAAPSASATAGPSASASAGTAAASPSGTASTVPSASATPSTPDATPPAAGATSAVAAPATDAVTPEAGSGGVPWWWGVVALVVLGGAGAVTVARRRA